MILNLEKYFQKLLFGKAAFASILGYYWYLRLHGWEIDDLVFEGWIYQVATAHGIRAIYKQDVLRLTRGLNNSELLSLERPK